MFLEAQAGWRLSSRKGRKEPKGIVVRRLGFDSRMPSQNRRAIILETQSCNTNAIEFYLHEGFELIGFDTCCYTNNDIGRREVRLDLGYFFHRDERRF